ncbi:hypothetical protein ACFV1B_27750 [Streptomyces sp. NPDC059637]|uniref:hypothetical protein n=1 Tax=Streptomyces TaxID=1883 RepID=UPI0031D6234B
MSREPEALPPPPEGESPAVQQVWGRVVRELADDLAIDAAARDRKGGLPFDEVSRLREAGLPALLNPPGPMRRGADWRTACAAVREIAAADGSVGELLGRHYALSWSGRFFSTPERAAALELRAVREQWLWAGSTAAPDTGAEPDLSLAPAGGGYLLNGSREIAAGVAVSDRLVLDAVCTATGDSLVVLVDPAHRS